MKCSRCAGLMVEDYSMELDLLEDDHEVLAWRCLNCGNIIEPVMLRNRAGSMITETSLV
jgi:RNase P subunit RPR2